MKETDATAPAARFSREMGISHAEFHRTLPAAVAPYRLRVTATTAVVERDERRLLITLHPQGERRIASLALPVTRVEFAFAGFSADQRREFMQRFDLYYQRGGG